MDFGNHFHEIRNYFQNCPYSFKSTQLLAKILLSSQYLPLPISRAIGVPLDRGVPLNEISETLLLVENLSPKSDCFG